MKKAILVALLIALSTPVFAQTGEPVKKSKSGVCHAPGSTYYVQTKNFTPYKTLQDYSGGRMPKR